MASGKAILTSDKVGAAADLIKPGQNGTIFKAGDLIDLTSHLNNLLQAGKKELDSMGECSKEFIKNRDFETQVIVMESIINGE